MDPVNVRYEGNGGGETNSFKQFVLPGANMLWNNLLEPVGAKSMKKLHYVMEKFRCPTEKAPFFFTKRNSRPYLKTGSQLRPKVFTRSYMNYTQLPAEYINSELGHT